VTVYHSIRQIAARDLRQIDPQATGLRSDKKWGPIGKRTALALPMKRSNTVLRPDPSRVLLRQIEPGDDRRVSGIVERIMAVHRVSSAFYFVAYGSAQCGRSAGA
jgi:hypothetical protein